jgi:hypothetical protein
MTPGIRKVALTAHVTFSVGWFGAIAGFEALAITGLVSGDAQIERAAYLAMEPTAWFVIVPFAFSSLFTGLFMSLGTKWGLFRHYWVLAKFLINTIAIAILLLHTRLIHLVGRAASERPLFSADLRGVRIQLVAIAGAALLALLVNTALAVFKPRGLTAYGRRKQLQERGQMAKGASGYPSEATGKAGSSRVKIVWALAGLLMLLLFVLHFIHGSGFGNHVH